MKKTTAAIVLSLFALCNAPLAKAAGVSKCLFCHKLTASHNIGPSLKNIIGREVGATSFGNYSKDLENGGWKWDETHLRKWMCNSTSAIKAFTGDRSAHTKMPAQHICSRAKQDAIIKALKAL